MGNRKQSHLNPSRIRKRSKKSKARREVHKKKRESLLTSTCQKDSSSTTSQILTPGYHDNMHTECNTFSASVDGLNHLSPFESSNDKMDQDVCGQSQTDPYSPHQSVLQCSTELVNEAGQARESTPTLLEFSFISENEYNDVTSHELYYEVEKEPEVAPTIFGNRIVDLKYVLNWSVNLQYEHSKICTSGRLVVKEEIRWGTGLVSKIIFKCSMCPKEYTYFTEDPNKRVSKINYGAVWGTLSTGSTFSHLKEMLSVMDVPPMTLYTFKQIENELAGDWKDELVKEMDNAASIERKHALDEGNVDEDGVPYITVYVDGGWSKRSYGHSYNALSGTAVIIGQFTGKLIFLGVRNKYCCICSRAANKQVSPGDHICFKNWSGSSAAMEADILVEGFCKSEAMYGLRYKIFIADGDSSVHAKIRQKVHYGQEVLKKECTNHVIKNLGKAVRNMKNDKGVNPEARKLLTIKIIEELEKRVHEAIYDNARGDVEELKKDIANSPLHVFEDHRKCRDIYCQNVGNVNVFKATLLKESGLLLHINGVLDNVLKKCHKLIDNETNNRAELFMAIMAKFNAGKRLNLIQRGSYETRSHLTGLRYNKGVDWHYSPWKNIVGESPGLHFKKYMETQIRSLEQQRSSRNEARETDSQKRQASSRKLVNTDYGPNAEEADLTEEEYTSEFNRKLTELQISNPEEQQQIAEETVGQFENPAYIRRRKNRLTASFFGQVIKRLETTSCHCLVMTIVSDKDSYKSHAMQYGTNNEAMVRAKFELENHVLVEESGLYIDINRGYLAASPDGLIGTDGLIEIKCLYSVQKEGLQLLDAIKKKKVACLQIDDDEKIKLKRTHNYYYQIQGQLNITNRKFCKFIVYSGDKNPLFIETIEKDFKFWFEKMVPSLERFYLNCILPNIIRGNVQKGKCIDPPYIVEAKKKKEEAQKRKQEALKSEMSFREEASHM